MLTITLTKAHTLFKYRDGELYWRVKSRENITKEKLAGTRNEEYARIEINGVRFLAHRIVFLMFHGYLPRFVDHIDGNKCNNKICTY